MSDRRKAWQAPLLRPDVYPEYGGAEWIRRHREGAWMSSCARIVGLIGGVVIALAASLAIRHSGSKYIAGHVIETFPCAGPSVDFCAMSIAIYPEDREEIEVGEVVEIRRPGAVRCLAVTVRRSAAGELVVRSSGRDCARLYPGDKLELSLRKSVAAWIVSGTIGH